jgi:exodeoxyribonuclease VII small subunit
MTHNSDENEVAPENFEQSFAQIETIVRQLEQGTLGLDASLAAYQQAVRHLRFCQSKLDDAMRSVELLQKVNPDGSYQAVALDDTDLKLEEKAAARGVRRSASTKKNATGADDLF